MLDSLGHIGCMTVQVASNDPCNKLSSTINMWCCVNALKYSGNRMLSCLFVPRVIGAAGTMTHASADFLSVPTSFANEHMVCALIFL